MDTIAFLTLFLGLALGPTDVKLSATDAVKRIEVRLDGASVATLASAPWTARVNLGRTLVPHRLSAIAYDASGERIASIEQKINVPRPTTEARIVVEHDRAGVPRKARVVWNSVASRNLRNVSVDLDGVPLTVAKDLSVALPPLSSTPHILRATVVTPGGDSGEATTLIGASLAAESDSQLTAVAVEVSGTPKRLPSRDCRRSDRAVHAPSCWSSTQTTATRARSLPRPRARISIRSASRCTSGRSRIRTRCRTGRARGARSRTCRRWTNCATRRRDYPRSWRSSR